MTSIGKQKLRRIQPICKCDLLWRAGPTVQRVGWLLKSLNTSVRAVHLFICVVFNNMNISVALN